jgi:hypothetical protein
MFSKTLDFVCWLLLTIFLWPKPTEHEKISMSRLKQDEWPPKDEYDPDMKKALLHLFKFKLLIPIILIIKAISYILSLYGL